MGLWKFVSNRIKKKKKNLLYIFFFILDCTVYLPVLLFYNHMLINCFHDLKEASSYLLCIHTIVKFILKYFLLSKSPLVSPGCMR